MFFSTQLTINVKMAKQINVTRFDCQLNEKLERDRKPTLSGSNDSSILSWPAFSDRLFMELFWRKSSTVVPLLLMAAFILSLNFSRYFFRSLIRFRISSQISGNSSTNCGFFKLKESDFLAYCCFSYIVVSMEPSVAVFSN